MRRSSVRYAAVAILIVTLGITYSVDRFLGLLRTYLTGA